MKTVVVSFNLNVATGRDELVGVLRYMRNKPDWALRIVSREEFASFLHSEKASSIAGLIASCPPDENALASLATLKCPAVLLEYPKDRKLRLRDRISLVSSDNLEVGRLGAKHILSLGRFASYGFVMPEQHYPWAIERANSFCETLRKSGIAPCVFGTEAQKPNSPEPNDLQSWLKMLPKPAAIMAAYDARAADVAHACKSLRLSIPKDVSLLGVDNDVLYCENLDPRLSSIQLNCQEQGLLAAKELNRLISARKPAKRIRRIEVPPKGLVERESTTPIAPAQGLVDRAKAFIDEYACTGIRVPDVVRHLHVSRRLADKRFRDLTGSTIGNEINRVRLSAVLHKIKAGERSPRKLAAACGFKNVKYLQNLFKRHFGTTIRQWQTVLIQKGRRTSRGRT